MISSSIISNNTATSDEGGGVECYGDATIIGSTIEGNTSAYEGGGIAGGGMLSVLSSTITNNMAAQRRRDQFLEYRHIDQLGGFS